MTPLPIDDVLPELRASLRDTPRAVLEAPTGAGKTTRVPPALLQADWLGEERILMLEPRRLAARAAARRMAQERGESVGQTIGYRVRMDTQVSRQTRVEVVTEGVLTRMIQDDPLLDGVGAVIFDEFHERSLQADLGLALALDVHESLRPDLRLLVMSATLDVGPVADLLDDAPRITSEGRTYPVDIHYADRRPDGYIEPHVSRKIMEVLPDTEGDVLVFLPGAAAIKRVQRQVEAKVPARVNVYPLFGNLPHREQDRAIEPSDANERKIVLSTPIAETSLTIDGVRVVIDSGKRRTPQFDPNSGMTQLKTVPISRASADQRAGRAGRTAPGVCHRLWTRHTHMNRTEHTPPEIEQADLAPLALELAAWGITDPDELRWLSRPPAGPFQQAQDLLTQLDALADDGTVTSHGREMAGLGMHPRLAHLLVRAQDLGYAAVGCDVAALLSERDIFRGQGEAPDADLRLRLDALQRARNGDSPTPNALRGSRIARGTLHRVQKMAGHWRRKLGINRTARSDASACGLLTAFAYPDRIAQRRSGSDTRFLLSNGQAAALDRPQLLSQSEYLACAQVAGRDREAQIRLAAPISGDDLATFFKEVITEHTVVEWDAHNERIRARTQERLGALRLKDGPLADPAPQATANALLDGLRATELELLPWSKNAHRLQQRLVFLHTHLDDWPDASASHLMSTLDDWLAPHLYGMRRVSDLRGLNLPELLKQRLSWDQRDQLGDLAPTHLTVPSGQNRPIDYSDPEAPALKVRLQEMFGATDTPRIAGGTVPLTLHLLSPAQRPVQITQDLAHFWDETYFEVKKEMKGRYPKHYWPDDPLTATATHRVRPR